MKFYCEHTKKIYDTMAECEAAEKAYLNEQNKKANAEKAAKDNLEKLYDGTVEEDISAIITED